MSQQSVLIIHDDPRVRSRASSLLRKLGHQVNLMSSPAKLVDFKSAGRPDLVLCKLPWCDEIDQRLSETCPKKHSIQYIQLFSNQSVEEVMDAFHKDNRDCLPIPFSERTLALSVGRALERRDLIAKNLRSQRRLVRANDQLEKSLGALEADAIAGRQLQQSLLPASPIVQPPYYYARKIVPSLYLSGDFVNYAPALDDWLLFYLMDVSGHGASSAFVTIMVRQLMRRIVRRQVKANDRAAVARAPEGFLERMNTIICDNELDKHLTIFSGSLNMKANRLRYVIGAHLPLPILVTEEGARFLPGKGRPVGLFAGGKWEVQEIELPEKFVLVAFSDGVLEQLPEMDLQQQENFLLKKLRGCPADIEKVLPRLGIESGENLADDIAVLMIARGYHEA